MGILTLNIVEISLLNLLLYFLPEGGFFATDLLCGHSGAFSEVTSTSLNSPSNEVCKHVHVLVKIIPSPAPLWLHKPNWSKRARAVIGLVDI